MQNKHIKRFLKTQQEYEEYSPLYARKATENVA